jgi:hypothetical protein
MSKVLVISPSYSGSRPWEVALFLQRKKGDFAIQDHFEIHSESYSVTLDFLKKYLKDKNIDLLIVEEFMPSGLRPMVDIIGYSGPYVSQRMTNESRTIAISLIKDPTPLLKYPKYVSELFYVLIDYLRLK